MGWVALTSECCHLQHQIASYCLITLWYKLNYFVTVSCKLKLLLVIVSLNYNVDPNAAEETQFGTITDNIRWGIAERSFMKIRKVASFHPKRRGNAENKNNSPVNIRFVTKTSDIRNSLKTSNLIRSDVISQVKPCLHWKYSTINAFQLTILTAGFSNSNCSERQMRTCKVTQEPKYV